MRELVKALPLGLLLPLVVGAASVKPDDAVSNFSAWATRFGITHVPDWVSSPAADNRIIFGAFGVAAIYAFLIWTVPIIREHRSNPGSDKLKNHLLLIVFLFSSAALVVSIWRLVPPPPSRSSAPISTSQPQLLSRMDRFIFACAVPPPDPESAATFQQQLEIYKQNLEVLGDAISMSITLTNIRGGVRIVVEANSPEAKRRMLESPSSRLTIEIRRVFQQLIATVFLDLPEILRFFSYAAPEPSAADTQMVKKFVERLVGAEDKCQLI
jgi:hypothetical protein